jgi:hypothetical protein
VHFVPIPTDLYSRSCYVYALFCQDGDGPGYVKFGFSTRIGDRLSAILVGCPLPAKMFAVIEFDDRQKAMDVEKSLHRHFIDRKAAGEWFRFDFSSQNDKSAFNDGCKKVFLIEHGISDWWSKISAEAVKREAEQRKKKFLASKSRRQLKAIENRRLKSVSERRYADAELSSKWQ